MAIDINDPLAKLVNCKKHHPLRNTTLTHPAVEDLEKYRPGLAKSFYDWFTASYPPTATQEKPF